MTEYAIKNDWEEKRYHPRDNIDRDYNVKLSIDKFKNIYQFTIKNRAQNSISLIIDNNLGIVPKLKVEERLNLIYYPKDTLYPRFNIRATIRHITKCDQVKSKNYYLVGLEILQWKN